jgi:hypothetical protein
MERSIALLATLVLAMSPTLQAGVTAAPTDAPWPGRREKWRHPVRNR